MHPVKARVEELVSHLEKDVAFLECKNAQVKNTEALLQHFIGGMQDLDISDLKPSAECYSRYLLYRHPKECFSIVMMVWGPGQSTSIHDHNGIWCVEGVVKGEIQITDFRLQENNDGTVNFTARKQINAGKGQVGNLIPPFEHHKIGNVTNETAVSLHVYGSEIKECKCYQPEANGSYRPTIVELSYNSEL